MIAFVWCYKTGIFIHEKIKKIEIKKHGRKAKSIFKCGLSFIQSVLLNAKNQTDMNIFNFLSCTQIKKTKFEMKKPDINKDFFGNNIATMAPH